MKIVKALERSKIAAVVSLFLIMVVIVITMVYKAPWWGFIYLFLWFMGAFTHLGALLTERLSASASRKLGRVAAVCGVAGTVAVIAEAVVFVCL